MIAWFGGQECGHALGDILTGAAEPGGRLPTTWPRSLADAPVSNVLPAQGVLPYDEGIHIGYRGWLRSKAEPAYWFGAGQGYTTFEVSDLAVSDAARPAGHFDVAVFVRNTGARRGKHVVQVYASRPASAVDRPMRWLVGFRPVVLDPAESTRVVVSVPSRALAYWSHDGWTYEPGEFMISVAGHAGDPGLFAPLELTVPKD
jgi:beta-glucosidase